MILIGKVEHGIAEHNHQLFVLVYEDAGQWSIVSLDDDVLTRPLPKLCLGGPKRFCVMANDQRCVFLPLPSLLLCFSFAHIDIPGS